MCVFAPPLCVQDFYKIPLAVRHCLWKQLERKVERSKPEVQQKWGQIETLKKGKEVQKGAVGALVHLPPVCCGHSLSIYVAQHLCCAEFMWNWLASGKRFNKNFMTSIVWALTLHVLLSQALSPCLCSAKVSIQEVKETGTKDEWLYWNELKKRMGTKLAKKSKRLGQLDTMKDQKGNTLYLIQRLQSKKMTKSGAQTC